MSNILFSFKGRINRKPYWIFMLAVFIGAIIAYLIDMLTTSQDPVIASSLIHIDYFMAIISDTSETMA